MIDRNKYFEIVNLYKKENNLTRLVYRIIKFDEEELSLEQVVNRVNNIRQRNNEIEELEKEKDIAIENVILSLVERLKTEGATDINRGNNDINYTENGVSYCRLTCEVTTPIMRKYDKIKYEKFYKDIELALKELITVGYVEGFEDKRYYISPYSGKRKIKSITTRYKAIK